MKKALKILAVILFLGCVVFTFAYLKLNSTWTGVIYSSTDSKTHDTVGNFNDLESCQKSMAERLKNNPYTNDNQVVDRYFCGSGCFIEAEFGSVTVDEYTCAEKHFQKDSSHE